ncbi:MAG: hypothetical protein AB8B96_19445 [Lysobacterales bacterium]
MTLWTSRLLVSGISLLCAAVAQASSFVPLVVPDGSDISSIQIDAAGNYAYTISRFVGEDDDGNDQFQGQLYLNGSPFVQFGPNERYRRLEQFAAAGSRAIFRAQIERTETPTQICGGSFQVFNGPNADPCPVYTPPTLLPFNFEERGLRTNSSGEVLLTTQPFNLNINLYAPQLARFANPRQWWTPVWGITLSSAPQRISLLENGRVAAVVGNCLQVYRRGTLVDPGNGRVSGLLELDSESCVDDGLTGGAGIAEHINPSNGNLSFCAGPNGFGGDRSVYLLQPGGTPQLVQENVGAGSACRVFGSDSAGNVAYGPSTQVFWSDQPAEPVLANGHIFAGKELFGLAPIAVLNDRTIIAIAQLRDPLAQKGGGGIDPGAGLFFSDGDTDFPPEPDPDAVIWSTGFDGSFFDDQNWNPKVSPSSDQVAIFAPDAAVTVTFGSQEASSERLLVERGPVTFDGGVYQLNSGSPANPSFVLRSGAPGDVAALWVRGGHQLQTSGATLEQNTSVGGQLNGVILEDDLSTVNPQSRWDNDGRLVVDASLSVSWSGGLVTDALRVASTPGSQGEVTVGPSAQSGLGCPDISIADFGDVSIGYAGQATMDVGRDCAVEATGDRVIGELADASGVVTFQDSSWVRFFNPGPATDLTVGASGDGTLRVLDGAVGANQVFVGKNVGGVGAVVVETINSLSSLVEAQGSLFVGAGGAGLVRTVDSGRIVAADVTAGAFTGGFGRIFLTGPSNETNLEVAGLMVIGENGEAEMEIVDGALARSQSGLIGGGAQGRGVVEIARGGAWDLDNDLTLGLSSGGADPQECDGDEISVGVGELRLLGEGQIADITGQTLTIDGPDSRLSGTGLAVFQNTLAINCAVLAPGNSPGTLTLDGNLDLRGGVIEVEVMGLGDGQYDVLQVAGTASLAGGVIRFIFTDFLPQENDQLTFLQSGAGLTLDQSMRYEYEGAIDGFAFDVVQDSSGRLMFSALNNALGDELFDNGFESP